ncbi:hypothetical protein WAI453_001835 [Rhynchosporium graminicola]
MPNEQEIDGVNLKGKAFLDTAVTSSRSKTIWIFSTRNRICDSQTRGHGNAIAIPFASYGAKGVVIVDINQ